MLTPPKGVDDVFGAVVVLLAGLEPNVIVQKNGRYVRNAPILTHTAMN